jgi:hypothetical protein
MIARTLVVGCGALARELASLLAAAPQVTLTCLPAILHNRPERIVPAVIRAVAEARPAPAQILVAYADCGTGGALARLCAARGWRMLPGPHCYALYDPAIGAQGEGRAFYVTDFLARQFDAFVTRPLGLDRHPELRDAYFGAYEALIHLAQSEDPALEARARAAARTLGLPYVRRDTGLGALPRHLAAGLGQPAPPA